MNSIYYYLLVFWTSRWVKGQGIPCLNDKNETVNSCHDCLAYPDCVWCPEILEITGLAIGCIKNRSYRCREREIVSRVNSRLVTNRPLHHLNSDQISPQYAEVKLSPNQKVSLDFFVRLADVPVDIYFVMDLSNSMGIHRDNLEETAEMIAEQVTHLTKDYHLGFGSFSDKVTPPFSSEASYYRNDATRTQPLPYSFYHHLSLTKNVTLFKQGVRKAKLAANVDSPESGLDALMQVITCGTDVIGWRGENVRKVIIFVTDEDTHYAYDGILGGLPIPQDNQCHMRRDRLLGVSKYTKELEMDYPSFGQIREELSKRNMAVIFAVDEGMAALYRELSRFIQGTENIGFLSDDTSSLEKIVVEQYKAIKSRVVIQTITEKPELFKLEFVSTCKNPSEDFKTCSGIRKDEFVQFTLNITMTTEACSFKDGVQRHELRIGLAGFPKDTFTIGLTCNECRCSSRANAAPCGGKGTLTCGRCECNPGFSGQHCECGPSNLGGSNSDSCVPPWGGTACQGRGKCCGKCFCHPPYIGDYCQCQEKDCPMGKIPFSSDNTLHVCSGQGTCKCDELRNTKCECNNNFKGDDCSCPTGIEGEKRCRDRLTNNVCFNQGSCQCGQCKCNPGFGGKYCHKVLSQTTCEKLEPCVKVHQFKPDPEITSRDEIEEYQKWEKECQSLTSYSGIKMFGEEIKIGCNLPGKDDSHFIYSINSAGDCEELIKTYLASQRNKTTEALKLQSNSHVTKFDFMSKIGLVECEGYHQGCEFIFYHDPNQEDFYFSTEDMSELTRTTFVIPKNISGTFKTLSSCPVTSMWIILVSALSSVFLIGVGIIVAVIVLINVNDLRKWKQHLAEIAENEKRLAGHSNPLYLKKETSSTFQNPAFSSPGQVS